MRISRIHTAQPLRPGELIRLEARPSHYLVRVLRLRRDGVLRVFNGESEQDYAAVLESPDERAALVRVGEVIPNPRESPLRLTLAQALCRGEKMDLVLQKAVELGVFAIQPLVSERTEVQLDQERSQRRLQHWRGVVIGACEQSGRSCVPEVHAPMALMDWLATQPRDQLVVLEPGASRGLASLPATCALSLVIGPEGGFSGRELESFSVLGIQVCSLGPRVLRTESAGLAAIAVLQSRFGDLV